MLIEDFSIDDVHGPLNRICNVYKSQTVFKILVLCSLTVFVTTDACFGEQNISEFAKAKKLESEDKTEEAFIAYLTVPGAEYVAASIGRVEPEKFIKILEKNKSGVAVSTFNLIKGDLLLALDKKEKALISYRSAAKNAVMDYYPVEITQKEYMYSEIKPFSYGPGSHRDNWLIRRFIALEAWSDAEREFKRIWGLHQKQKPFTGLGLEFAIDYAYFLKRQNNTDESLQILLEVMQSIDMDHNPNLGERAPSLNSLRVYGFSRFSGMSRKEFIRLAYGIFKNSGKEEVLFKSLNDEINSGNNIARRTFAVVQLQKGNQDESLNLELDYIKNAEFDQLTIDYRRGLIYESYSKLGEAISDYESALDLPYSPPNLPDKDEEELQRQMMMQAMPVRSASTSESSRVVFQEEILSRLNRIYVALGQMDKSLEVSLRQFDINPKLFENLEVLEQTSRNYQAAGRESEFLKWVRNNINKIESDLGRAHLFWMAEDYKNTAESLVSFYENNGGQRNLLYQWKEKFRKKGEDKLKILLSALVNSDPKDAISRLELLDLEGRFEGKEIIDALEILLDEESPPAFARGKGTYNRTQFRNYYDLAYRLMRLYEKNGKIEELVRLGLRIAEAERPFHDWPKNIKDGQEFSYRNENDFPEDLNSCFSLLIQYADDRETRIAIEKALEDNPYFPAMSQLERKKQKDISRSYPQSIPFSWANLPDGVSLITSNENILSLGYDEKYIFTGHPWGVGVYTREGEPVTRIALSTAGLVLESQDNNLWVGTPIGLYKIDKKDWKVSYLRCDQDLYPSERNDKSRFDFNNGVLSLALDGDILWIGTRRNIQSYNVKTGTLSVFSKDELKLDSHGDWSKFIIETRYVWADGYFGSRRFDKETQQWEAIIYEKKPVHLIALVDGELWGHVNLGEPLRDRPCIIDKDSLKVTPILIEGNLTEDQQCINGPFWYYGKKGDRLIFQANQPFEFNRERMKLKPIDVAELPDAIPLPGLKFGIKWIQNNGISVTYDGSIDRQMPIPGFHLQANSWQTIELDNKIVVLGAKLLRSPRYQYPTEDWPTDEDREVSEYEGGLYFTRENKGVNRKSSGFSNSILGDHVYSIVFDDKNNRWLTTSLGIAVLDENDKVIRSFSRKDGLISNRVTSGVLFSDKIYFSSGWGNSGGGLIVYNQNTKVFTSFVKSDGLPSNKIKSVTKEGNNLLLEFLSEYQCFGNFNYIRHLPACIDPISINLLSGGEQNIISQSESMGWDKTEQHEELPFLGGYVINRIRYNNKTYLCGTRGLVIFSEENQPYLEIAQAEAYYTPSNRQIQIKEAKDLKVVINNPDDLRKYLGYQNGFIRAKALATLNWQELESNEEYVHLLTELVKDDNIYVRSTNIYLLSRLKNEKIIPALKLSLNDSDSHIRAVAALALARQSIIPELSYFEEILEHPDSYGGLPFGIDSTIGVQVSELGVYEALAPHADENIFQLFMKYPLPANDYEPRQKVFAILGKSLQNTPESAEILLEAYDRDPYSWGQQRFSQAVFKYTGSELLPILHQALLSKNRIVRSNAARACGSIANPSSIAPLINRLDLESGLSQASIVWALGELRAEKAVPYLVTLYVKVKNDEKRRAGSGFRAAQSAATIQSQYDTIANLDSISSDWDELKASLAPEPIKPREGETLLSSEIILEAVSKIGINATQEFYRKLAGESDAVARKEAAINLSRGDNEDTQKNLQILRGLLADSAATVRMEAAISLLILGEKKGEEYISNWLRNDRWEKTQILKSLLRIKDPKELIFAKDLLSKCMKDITLDEYTQKTAEKLFDLLNSHDHSSEFKGR